MTGKEIKAIRERLGLTQTELADKLGITRNAVTLWEIGQRNPSSLAALAIKALEKELKPVRKGKRKS
jgi:DNA-binding transcriptional regulator YiaG